jgi:acetyl esterase
MISENDQRFLSGFFEAMKDMRFPASVAEYRSMIDGIDPLKNSPPLPEVGSYHESVELRAGLNSAIAVPKTNGPFPVFVICHGNGGIWGSSHSYRRLTRDVACAGYLAITPDYRLAPEHKFPAGFEDMKYAVHWAYENAKRFGGDASRVVLCGDSTGAGLAFSVALAVGRQSNSPKLKAVVGLEGIYDRAAEVPVPGTGTPDTSWMLKAYLGDNHEALVKDDRVSPIYGIEKGLLPSVLLMTGSSDFAAPGTFQFAQALFKAAVPFQLHVVEGMIHDFMKISALDGKNEGHRLMFEYLRRCV